MPPEWPPPPPSYDNALCVPRYLFADEYSYDYIIRTQTPRFIARFDHELLREVGRTPEGNGFAIDVVQWLDPMPPQPELLAIFQEIAAAYSYHKRYLASR